ncbi:MAG: aminomethyl-transferring glycine dehydrogenase subunit GcvPA [Christensenellales bacterium]|jgi:glycine dehydrogenase subunit 1
MAGYIPSTRDERQLMLKELGMKDYKDLYVDVPASVLLDELPGVAKGVSEMEAEATMRAMAEMNVLYPTVLRGAGIYDHYIPSIVDTVAGKEEFVTAYTPYQAEISQGVLQSIFEYQTMICELTGMDASNASVYDGASAAAEGAMMCLKRNRNVVYVADNANPETIETIKTYAYGRDVKVEMLSSKKGVIDVNVLEDALCDEAACLFIQQPNFYGLIEDIEAIADKVHNKGAKLIVGCYPTALGMLESPGALGADIATGDGQPLGIPMGYGGPTVGFMATKKAMVRQLPGRIVGQTTDSRGDRAFVLTLQAREQHIRREKASSNICSNQALCALRAGVYMAVMGKKGLCEAAELSYDKAHYLAKRLSEIPGIKMVYDGPYFNEFMTTLPVDAARIEKALHTVGILSGLPVDGGMLWCVTEKATKEALDLTVQTVRGAVSK